MIQIYKTARYEILNFVKRNNACYSIESEVGDGLYYVLSEEEVALLRGNDAWRMDWKFFKRLIPYAEDEKLQEEMVDVLEDYKHLKSLSCNFKFVEEGRILDE